MAISFDHPRHTRFEAPQRGAPDPAGVEAFERLYGEHALQVRRVVRRYLWGAVVDDVVQETFAQAFRSGVHLDACEAEGGTAARRLVGMARNRSIDVLRQRMRGAEEIADNGRLSSLPALAGDADPEAGFLASCRRQGIAEALDALCERQRRVLFLRHVEGLAYDEIAEREGITTDGVKATLARARKSFRHMYASIAEREGLSVLLGGPVFRRLLDRLQARLRGARNRIVSGVDQAVTSFAAVSPGIANTLLTVFVAGSVLVMGAGAAAAEQADHPDSAPALAAFMHTYETLIGATELAAARIEAQTPSTSALSHPIDGTEAAVSVPGPGPVSQEASATVDTDELAPVSDAPASAQASVAATAEANPEEGQVQTQAERMLDGVTDGVDVNDDEHTSVQVGCHDPDGPVTSVVCPLLAS